MQSQTYQTRVEQVDAIQWTGSNLQQVLNFTGKASNFDDWFDSFEQYQKYVAANGNVFKLFFQGKLGTTKLNVCVDNWIVRDSKGCITVWDSRGFHSKFEMSYDSDE